MKHEFSPYLSYLFEFHAAYLSNIADAMTGLCCLVLFLKLRAAKPGTFRGCLMLFFGVHMIAAFSMAILYHPLWNPWLVPVRNFVTLIPLIILTGDILKEFWRNHAK